MQHAHTTLLNWTREMDSLLNTLVGTNGTDCWKKIADAVNIDIPAAFVTPEECENRWHYLEYGDSKEVWTDKEELELFIAHRKYHNKWSEIADVLGKRSNNSIKNRFYSIFRKIKNKVKRKDTNCDSSLEVAEAFYIIRLMEKYFSCPHPIKERNGRRGKDFIHSLLKGLDADEVAAYKAELSKQNKESTLEELLQDITRQNRSANFRESKDVESSKIERARCVLPLPHGFSGIKSFTDEEKQRIYSQFFRKNEPKSAPIFISGSIFLTPSIQFSGASSLGLVQGTSRFEGFSEFVALRRASSQ
eukprot:TRINITY_DN934_c0_g1_i15.p1 TRINITY_DN934_c0_g1~~TRINITY_DN934_c0_g1_i15.p1  ORF type:complete len:304 (+),score=48.15 TRINITY_DN934_c0_g1_i15:163-1074(+)